MYDRMAYASRTRVFSHQPELKNETTQCNGRSKKPKGAKHDQISFVRYFGEPRGREFRRSRWKAARFKPVWPTRSRIERSAPSFDYPSRGSSPAGMIATA